MGEYFGEVTHFVIIIGFVRLFRSNSDDGFVEPGAQFIHGEKGNQLFELAQKYGLLMGAYMFQSCCLTITHR